MSMHEPFFSFLSRADEVMIQYAARDALRKKCLGALLNYKEAGIVICRHVIEEAHIGKPLKQIIDSFKKLLNPDDVMIGVPEIMQKLVLDVRFKNGKNR